MILFYNPRATRPRNRRLPLSILAIAAVIEGKEAYAIVDGNLDPNPLETLLRFIKEYPIELHAVTVMPGPQLVVSSRWPTVQDIRLPNWGRLALKALSSWRYRLGIHGAPLELKWLQQVIELRKPKAESL